MQRAWAVLAAAAFVLVACAPEPPQQSDDRSEPTSVMRTVPPTPDAGNASSSSEAGVIPAAPFPGRSGALAVWVDERLWVWGGFGEPYDDRTDYERAEGALYDPAAGEWEPIAPAPIAPSISQMAVWTGDEVLVWGEQGGSSELVDTAAYDPATDRWRLLPPDPLTGVDGGGARWTGAELLVWGTRSVGDDEGTLDFAAYDPARDAWRDVSAPPLAGPRFGPAAVWTGEALVVWGGSRASAYALVGCEPVCNDIEEPLHGAAAYDPVAGAWTSLPDPPADVVRGGAAVWLGNAIVTRGGLPHELPRYYRFDPYQAVATPISEAPPRAADGELVVSADRIVAVAGSSGVPGDPRPVEANVYDPARDLWTVTQATSFGANQGYTVAASPDRVFVVGGFTLPPGYDGGPTDETAGGVILDPRAEPPASNTADDLALSVGVQGDDDVPLTFSVDAPETLPLEGRVNATLGVSAEQDVYVQPDPETPGLLEVGEGRLIAVESAVGVYTDPAHPELGVQGATAQLPPAALYRAGRTPLTPLTLVTQAPPFAPAEGTYEQRVRVRWWHYRAPPEPYPSQPDGVGTITIAYTLEALSDAAAEDRTGQSAAQQALALPACATDEPTLQIGADPLLSATVDAAGWFGQRSYGARQLGGTAVSLAGHPQAGVVGTSVLLLDGRPLRECVNPTFRVDATITEDTEPRVVSAIPAEGLGATLEQVVEDRAAAGVALVQRLTVTNTGTAPRTVVLSRYFEALQAYEAPAPAVDVTQDGRVITISPASGPALQLATDLDGAAPAAWTVGGAGWLDLSPVVDDQPLTGGGLPSEHAGEVGWLPEGPPLGGDPAIPVAPLQVYETVLAPGAATTLTAALVIVPAE